MSRDVRVKEEPIDFECSPFELLNEIGQNDDVTPDNADVTGVHTGQIELSGTQPVIKHEHQGIVKTEITVGEQYDEECSVVNTQSNDPDVQPTRALTSYPRAMTSYPRAMTSSVSAVTSSSVNLSHEQQPEVSTESEQAELPVLHTEPVDTSSNLSMKMELPAKYKTLFDGVKAFPEMAKEILPIIEELVHFHNCICLLRRDLNLHRCEDCGRGFVTAHRVKLHARHCVVQKLENRFAPASITRHIGPTLAEDTETESLTPSQSETETKSNEGETETEVQDKGTPTSRPKRGRTKTQEKRNEESDPEYTPEIGVTIKSEVQVGPVFRVSTHPVTGEMTVNKHLDAVLTPPKGKRKRTRKAKEDREFDKGTCWGIPKKTTSCRITRVVEHNQFNQKKINPYHVFRYYGEVLYHNAIPMSLNFQGTAQNVFNTMISSIVEVGKLVPITTGRNKYMQVLQKQQKPPPPPDLELLPTPPSPELLPNPAPTKCIRRSKSTSEPRTKQNKQQQPPFKKIKIVCMPKSSAPTATSSAAGSSFGIGNRRTKTCGVPPAIKKPVNPGLSFDISGRIQFSKTSKTMDVFNPVTDNINPQSSSASSTFDPTPMIDGDPFALRFNKTAVRDHLKERLRGYWEEENFKENYVLEDHTILFLKNFLADSFVNAPSVIKRVNRILKDIQDTIPDSEKAAKIAKTRSDIADIIEQKNYAKTFQLDSTTVRFMESFAFGVANPSGKDIGRACDIVDLVGVRKMREKLVTLCQERYNLVSCLDVSTRVFIENFTSRVRSDKLNDEQFAKITNIIQLLENNHDSDSKKVKEVKEKDSVEEPGASKHVKMREESSSSDSINESDLSSPEIMRSCPENPPVVIPVTVNTDFQPGVDLKCSEELDISDMDGDPEKEVSKTGLNLKDEVRFQTSVDQFSTALDKTATGGENDIDIHDHDDYFEKNIQAKLSSNPDHFVSFCSVFVKKCKTFTSDLKFNGTLEEESIFVNGETFTSVFRPFSHPVIAMIPALAVIGRLEIMAGEMSKDHPTNCPKSGKCFYQQIWDFIYRREFRYLQPGNIGENPSVTDVIHQKKVHAVFIKFKNAIEQALDTYLLSKYANIRIYMNKLETIYAETPVIRLKYEQAGLRELNALLKMDKISEKFLLDKKKNLGRIKTALMVLENQRFNLKPIFFSEEQCKETLEIMDGFLLNAVPISINFKDLQNMRKFISDCMFDKKFLEKIHETERDFLERFHLNRMAGMTRDAQYQKIMAILDKIYERMDQEKQKQKILRSDQSSTMVREVGEKKCPSANSVESKVGANESISSPHGSVSGSSLSVHSSTKESQSSDKEKKRSPTMIIVKKTSISESISSSRSQGSVAAEPIKESGQLDVPNQISRSKQIQTKDKISENESSDADSSSSTIPKKTFHGMNEFEFDEVNFEDEELLPGRIVMCDMAEALSNFVCSPQQMTFDFPGTRLNADFTIFRACKKHLILGDKMLGLLSTKRTQFKALKLGHRKSNQFRQRYERAHWLGRKSAGTQTVDLIDLDEKEEGGGKLNSKSIPKEPLIRENIEAKGHLKKVNKSNEWLQWRISDLERQLEEERQMRSTITEVSAQWQDSNKKLKEIQENNEKVLDKLQKENQELRSFAARTRKSSTDSRRSSVDTQITISKLQADIEELKKTNSEVQTANTELYQNLCKKDEEVKSLEVSIQSISEALRLQTKTISTLSRKHYDSLVEEHNSKVLGGYESLVAITCKVLGDQQSLSKQKIEDPVKMREICESVAGDENLFSIFMRVFCGNSVCKDDAEVQATEKRVLFLMNLMTYFYNGTSGEEGGEEEGEEDTPSSSGLSSLL